MIEIYVNDRLVDLPKSNLDLGIDYAIFDVNSIGNRQGVRSYSLDLPLTNNNKQIFDSAEMITNTGTLPYTKIKARILVDGIDILIRFCTLKQAGSKFRCEFYGGNTDLFSSLKDKFLTDLNTNEYDHLWNIQNIYDSFTNTSGYIYGIIDYQIDSPNSYINNGNREYNVTNLLPSVFVNSVLDMIFADSDYTLVNEIAEDTANVIMPLYFGDVPYDPYVKEKYEGEWRILSDMTIPDGLALRNVFKFDYVNFNTGNYYAPPYQTTTGDRALRIVDRVYYTLDLKLDLTFNSSANWLFLDIEFLDIDGNTVLTIYSVDYQNAFVAGTNYFELSIPFLNVQVPQDALYVVVNLRSFGSFFGDGSPVILESTSSITVKDVSYGELHMLTYNNFVDLCMIMPKITQADFVKNYLLLFGLIPVVSDVDNTVTFVKFDKVLSNIGSALDWTNKIDLSEVGEIEFISDKYGQKNNFKYTTDGDEIKPIGTDGVLTIDNANLEPEVDLVEVLFASSVVNQRLVAEDIAQVGIYETGVFKSTRVPRILNVDFKQMINQPILPLILKDGVSTIDTYIDVPIPYFIKDADFNLGFGNNILDNYYSIIQSVISQSKILSLLVKLSSADINQLDFTIPIYLQQYESYFYINKIEGYSPNSNTSCSVELVKLNL